MQNRSMSSALAAISDKWWLWLVRGILAIILGIIALVQPLAAVFGIVIWLGAYFLVDGVVSLFHGFGEQPEGRSRWPLIIWGVVGILAGLSIFINPVMAGLTIAILIGIWAIIFGVMEIVTGIRMREVIDNEFWLILGGIASIIFGIIMLRTPVTGIAALTWVFGIWALVVGVTLVLLSFRIKGMGSSLSTV